MGQSEQKDGFVKEQVGLDMVTASLRFKANSHSTTNKLYTKSTLNDHCIENADTFLNFIDTL